MRWNLRLKAAERGIWKSAEMRRRLADAGLEFSAGKMSALWSTQPVSLKLDDLDVICAVLGCQIGELLIPEPGKVSRPSAEPEQRAASGGQLSVVPRRRDGRSLPPA